MLIKPITAIPTLEKQTAQVPTLRTRTSEQAERKNHHHKIKLVHFFSQQTRPFLIALAGKAENRQGVSLEQTVQCWQKKNDGIKNTPSRIFSHIEQINKSQI